MRGPERRGCEKLAYYLMGNAIGFVLLGLDVRGKNQAQVPATNSPAPAPPTGAVHP